MSSLRNSPQFRGTMLERGSLARKIEMVLARLFAVTRPGLGSWGANETAVTAKGAAPVRELRGGGQKVPSPFPGRTERALERLFATAMPFLPSPSASRVAVPLGPTAAPDGTACGRAPAP